MRSHYKVTGRLKYSNQPTSVEYPVTTGAAPRAYGPIKIKKWRTVFNRGNDTAHPEKLKFDPSVGRFDCLLHRGALYIPYNCIGALRNSEEFFFIDPLLFGKLESGERPTQTIDVVRLRRRFGGFTYEEFLRIIP